MQNADTGMYACGKVFFHLIEREGLPEYMEVIYLLCKNMDIKLLNLIYCGTCNLKIVLS